MAISKKGIKNSYNKQDTGGNAFIYTPNTSEDYFSIALKNKIILELVEVDNNYQNNIYTDVFTQNTGKKGTINAVNTNALYNADLDSYFYNAGNNKIETNQIISTSTPIQKILVSEITGDPSFTSSNTRIEVSLNNGSNYSFTSPTNYKYIDEIIDVSGIPYTAGPLYQMKLKLYIDSARTLPASVNAWSSYASPVINFGWGNYNNLTNQSLPRQNIKKTNSSYYFINAESGLGQMQEYNTVSNSWATRTDKTNKVPNYAFGDSNYIHISSSNNLATGTVNTATEEIYNVLTNSWAAAPSVMPVVKMFCCRGKGGNSNSGIVLKGVSSITFSGGSISSTTYSNTDYKYTNGVWSALGTSHPNSNCFNFSVTGANNSDIYAGTPGGTAVFSEFPSFYYYNGTTWLSKALNPSIINGIAYYKGGIHDNSQYVYLYRTNQQAASTPYSALERYNKASNSWTSMATDTVNHDGFASGLVVTTGTLYGSNKVQSGAVLSNWRKFTLANNTGLRGYGIKIIYD